MLTREKFKPLFEDIKDLIKTTAKGTEAVIKRDINELRTDVAEIKTDVATLKTDVATLKTDVVEIKGEMHQMEERLSAKIDQNLEMLEDHEARITVLESA